MPEPEPLIRQSNPSREPRPWEQDRTNEPNFFRRWQRALQSPDRKTRWGSRAALVGAVALETVGAAGALHAASAILPTHVDTGLVPHPTPGIEPVPPTP